MSNAPIEALKAAGFETVNMGSGRYRIGGRIDYWPKQNRWCDIKTLERGDVQAAGIVELARARLCTT